MVIYKGYGIRVYWTDSDMGFRYIIFDKDAKTADESAETYFYSENAMEAAKRAVDAIAEKKA